MNGIIPHVTNNVPIDTAVNVVLIISYTANWSKVWSVKMICYRRTN